MTQAMIDTENLTRTFGNLTAVDNLNFHIEKGEVFGFLGPNGAGKTTTIRMLACLISPTKGTATVAGHDIHRDPFKVRQSVGILTENPSLYERLTAYENMNFFAQAYGVSDQKERTERIHELLDFFDLRDREAQRVAHLSKGMKQKLAIARALVHKPQVLLLDEPTAGLDPESAIEVRTMITRLSNMERRTILLSTHRLGDAEKLCDRVMIVVRGGIVASGTPESLREGMTTQPVLEVTLKTDSTRLTESIRNIASVKALTMNDPKRLMITLDNPESSTPEVIETIVRAGGQILSVKILERSLEDVYLQLVKESAH